MQVETQKTFWTQDEFDAEARRRFPGKKPIDWAFQCPNCGDIATPRHFRDIGAHPRSAGQECIGRHWRRQEDGVMRGCDWTAYGVVRGPWEVAVLSLERAEVRTLPAFPFAPAEGVSQ